MAAKSKVMPKNKRHMREMQMQDPIRPVRHKAGTKPARRAKKFTEEMKRKAFHHMMEHKG